MTIDTSTLTDVVDTYIDMWNEEDADRRAELIRTAWTDDARYRDPLLEADGPAGLSEMVATVHGHYPGHRFRRTSGVDVHHDLARSGGSSSPPTAPSPAASTSPPWPTTDACGPSPASSATRPLARTDPSERRQARAPNNTARCRGSDAASTARWPGPGQGFLSTDLMTGWWRRPARSWSCRDRPGRASRASPPPWATPG